MKKATTKRRAPVKTRTPQEQMRDYRRNFAGRLPKGSKIRRIVELASAVFEPSQDNFARAIALNSLTDMLQEESKPGERIFITLMVTFTSYMYICDTPEEWRAMIDKINAVRERQRARHLAAGKPKAETATTKGGAA